MKTDKKARTLWRGLVRQRKRMLQVPGLALGQQLLEVVLEQQRLELMLVLVLQLEQERLPLGRVPGQEQRQRWLLKLRQEPLLPQRLLERQQDMASLIWSEQ